MTPSADTVVLLHGLARTARAFHALAETLRDDGYRVANLDYPSRTARLADLAAGLEPAVADLTARLPVGGRLHLVGHSLGSLVARHLATGIPLDQAGRIVMLGPPNHGSAIADRLLGLPVVRTAALAALGPALHDLTTRCDDADIPTGIGIIAGTRTLDPLGWLLLNKPNDGRVTVAATRLPGARHLTLPVSHALMPSDDRVAAAMRQFLRTGSFSADDHD